MFLVVYLPQTVQPNEDHMLRADVLVNDVKEETYWSRCQTSYKSTTACVNVLCIQGSMHFHSECDLNSNRSFLGATKL